MKYIIMCGGGSINGVPKQMAEVNGEEITARTIRLLRNEGVTDIAISSCNKAFERYGVPVLEHHNSYFEKGGMQYWVDGFYPMDEPTCYIFGDVFFSPAAIHTIVTTQTDDVEFFASAPPFAENYPKRWGEPFAMKVTDQDHFKRAIKRVKELCDRGQFIRHPVSWELWQVLKDTPINYINFRNFTAINDYTCDVDHSEDLSQWRYINE